MFFTSFLALAAVASQAALALPTISARQSFDGDTQNGLAGACQAVTVIFARGTFEPGNVGLLVGPPLFNLLSPLVGGDMAVQGVDYTADQNGWLAGGDPAGSQNMANLVNQAVAKCPSTKIVMVGYSQGAELVHKAAGILGATMSKVSSVVTFGDPDQTQAVAGISSSKVKVFCNAGDLVCFGMPTVLPPHLTYKTTSCPAAVTFIKSNL